MTPLLDCFQSITRGFPVFAGLLGATLTHGLAIAALVSGLY